MPVSVIRHSDNKGYEKALSSGLDFAVEHDYIYAVSFDADGQMFVEDIEKFFSLQKRDADIVIGKRKIKNRIFEYLVGGLTRFIILFLTPMWLETL